MTEECTECGAKLAPDRTVWLERNAFTGKHYLPEEHAVPQEESQGLHPFGATCARKKLRESK